MNLSNYNIFFVLFVLFLSHLYATCPNNCNNHGTCTNNVCTCDPLTGLGLSYGFGVPAYTGADCSMRTCPLGFPFGATYRELTVEPAPEFIVGGTVAPTSKARGLESDESPSVTPIQGMEGYAYKITGLGADAMEKIGQLNHEGGVISCTYGGKSRNPPTSTPAPTTTTDDDSTEEATPNGGGNGLRELDEIDEFIQPSKKGRADVKGFSRDDKTAFIVFDRAVGENDTNLTYGISYITFNSIISMRTDLTLYNPTEVTDDGKIVWPGYGDVLETMGFAFTIDDGARLLEETTTPDNYVYKFACFGENGTIYNYTARDALLNYTSNDVTFKFEDGPDPGMQCLLLAASGNRTVDIDKSDASVILTVDDDGNIVVKIPGNFDVPDGRKNSTFTYDGDTITFEFTSVKSQTIIQYAATNNAILFPTECYEDSKLDVVEGNSMTIKFGLARDPYTIDIMAISDDSGEDDESLSISFQSDELTNKLQTFSELTGRMLGDSWSNSITSTVYISIGKDGVRSARECSGAGYCNRISGECECLPGYDGDACQRMSCPNNCNGNGRCVTLPEIVSTAEGYTGYGHNDINLKLYGCKCEPGRRGSDCSLIECPSGKDPLGATNTVAEDEYRDCSGRGKCDYATGVCTCFNGFYGDGCQHQISNS